MKVKPLGSKVLVKRLRMGAMSDGGIVIPETARKKRASEGEVVLIGPLVAGLEPGQRVVFERYGGIEFELEGEAHLFLEHDELEAVEAMAA